jgi:hypothetical protein
VICLRASPQIQRERGEVGHRFVEVIERRLDVVLGDALDHQHVVDGAEMLRDDLRIIQFAEALVRIADGERPQLAGNVPPHQRDQRAGVEAAGEEHAERYVRHQVRLHTFIEQRLHFEREVLDGLPREVPLLEAQIPILRDLRIEHRLRRGHELEAEVIIERLPVQPTRHVFVLQDRLDLRREPQLAIAHVVVERLDADAVARDPQQLLARIPDRKREHPAQLLHRLDAVLLVRVDDDFRIRPALEQVPAPFEFGPQFEVIVDLPVEHDLDRTILVRHRLSPVLRQINDAQPAMAQRNVIVAKERMLVGPAMRDDIRHPLDEFRVTKRESCNTTHKVANRADGVGDRQHFCPLPTTGSFRGENFQWLESAFRQHRRVAELGGDEIFVGKSGFHAGTRKHRNGCVHCLRGELERAVVDGDGFARAEV